jgi:hypothetical protein
MFNEFKNSSQNTFIEVREVLKKFSIIYVKRNMIYMNQLQKKYKKYTFNCIFNKLKYKSLTFFSRCIKNNSSFYVFVLESKK